MLSTQWKSGADRCRIRGFAQRLKSFLAVVMLTLPAACAGPWYCPEGGTFSIASDAAFSGRGPDAFAEYQQVCTKAGRPLDRAEWDRGYKDGLERYCTPGRAYQVGFAGYFDFHGDRCPVALRSTLDVAFRKGERCGEIQEDLDDLNEDDDDEGTGLSGRAVRTLFRVIREEALTRKWQEAGCYR